jgi:hypothetical protein
MDTKRDRSQIELRDSLLWQESRRLVVTLGEATKRDGSIAAMIARAVRITLLIANASDSKEETQKRAVLDEAQRAAVELENEMIRDEHPRISKEVRHCLEGIIRLLAKKNLNYKMSALICRFV